MLKKPPNGRFRSEILRFIFFFTHVLSSGVHHGQYKSRFGPRSRTILFFKHSYLFLSPKQLLFRKFRSGSFRFIYFLTHLSNKKIVVWTFRTSATCIFVDYFSKICFNLQLNFRMILSKLFLVNVLPIIIKSYMKFTKRMTQMKFIKFATFMKFMKFMKFIKFTIFPKFIKFTKLSRFSKVMNFISSIIFISLLLC